jgi:hypothetical protein
MDAATLKSFKRTHISRRDFEAALRFIRAARLHDNATPEHEALLIAAVLMYARPFSSNERNTNADADSRLADDLVKFDGPKLELHDQVIQLRNKAVAHAESTYYPVKIIEPFIPGAGFATSSRRWHVVNPQLDLDLFEAVAVEMHQLCLNRQFDLGRGHAVTGAPSATTSKKSTIEE